MKQIRLCIVAGLLLALAVPMLAAYAESPIHLSNRLRVGYDDNINLLPEDMDPVDSFRLIEELEFLVNLNMERMYLGLRYRPSLIWYTDRDEANADNKDYDFLNDLDLNFSYEFTPSLALALNDTLRASQLPSIYDEYYIVRRDDDNIYNSALATLSYNILPKTRLDLSGRHILLDYDNEESARYGNYYSLVGGLTLRQQLASRTTVLGDARYQTLTYSEAPADHNRDADMIFFGLGAEQTFSPSLIGSLRAGIENRQYDDEDYDDHNAPYGEASLTFLPSPRTRLTGAASYSIDESDAGAYLSQNRTYLSLSLAHDITAKWSFYASTAFTLNEYDADYALDDTDPATPALDDGTEKTYLVSLRLAYRINRINWLELGYQFTKLDTDLQNRESYDRNRVDLGWKIQLF